MYFSLFSCLGWKRKSYNKRTFWNRLEEIKQENYALNQISGVDKLSTFMQHSVDTGGNLVLMPRIFYGKYKSKNIVRR